MHLVDSHIHLDFSAFNKDREALLEQACAMGIDRFVVPATTRQSWPDIDRLARTHREVLPGYGIHPYFTAQHSLDDCEALDSWLGKHAAVAVGEIGLDYFLKELNRAQQAELFDAQLTIARQHGLPVILHARKAVDEVILHLRNHAIDSGIVHSFSGSRVQAERLIEMGFKLGFGGAITYPRATRLRKLVANLPLDSICIETDAPDQPSFGFMGRRNQPVALLEVLETVARLRNLEPEIIARQTTDNTYEALNIC